MNKIFSISSDEKYHYIYIAGFRIRYRKKIKAVAVIDVDGIGDYILSRHYLKYIKQKFPDKKLVYFTGNRLGGMPDTYDKDTIFEIISYEDYTEVINGKIKKYSFDLLIYLGGLWGQFIGKHQIRLLVKRIKAPRKYTSAIYDGTLEDLKKNYPSINIYTDIIITKTGEFFDHERKRYFLEKILDMEIPYEDVSISPIFDFKNDYILVSPYTAQKERNWTNEEWIKVINYIANNIRNNIKIVFLGSHKDIEGINSIISAVNQKSKCINMAGKTDVSVMPYFVKNASFLLSLETGTVHIAEAVGCKALCLCCGAYYKRFQPYNDIEYIYPNQFEEILKSGEQDKIDEFYKANWEFCVSDIPAQKVINTLDKYITTL